MNEELIETGIVIKSSKGIAEIQLKEKPSCEECTAKILCSSQGNKARILRVSDPIGSLPGQEVKIAIKGSEVLKASVLLYGIPLIILLAGIMAGMTLFDEYKYPELYSVITGVIFAFIYYMSFYFKSSATSAKIPFPKIISAIKIQP